MRACPAARPRSTHSLSALSAKIGGRGRAAWSGEAGHSLLHWTGSPQKPPPQFGCWARTYGGLLKFALQPAPLQLLVVACGWLVDRGALRLRPIKAPRRIQSAPHTCAAQERRRLTVLAMCLRTNDCNLKIDGET